MIVFDSVIVAAVLGILALVFGTGLLVKAKRLGAWALGLPGRLWRRWAAWREERAIRGEHVKQEKLRTAILEEELRNQIVRDLYGESRGREKERR